MVKIQAHMVKTLIFAVYRLLMIRQKGEDLFFL